VIATDTGGNASFGFDSPIAVPAGQFVTSTATRLIDDDDNPATPDILFETSEFSAPIAVKPLTNGVLFDASAGTLTVAGTSNKDTISIMPTADGKHAQVKINGATKSSNILLSAINQINVLSYDGNDSMSIASLVNPTTDMTIPVNVDGGAGTNSLV